VTRPSNDSNERGDGQLELGAEERRFREALLTAAERLDVPSNLLESRLCAALRERLPDESGVWRWKRLDRVVVGLAFALAAAVSLLWGVNRSRGLFELEPESFSVPTSAETTLAAAAAPLATRLLVWDGDTRGTNATGWASQDKSGKSTSTIETLVGVGYANSIGLKWHTEGPEWTGFGWNWFSWYPRNAGTDISGYQQLTFHFRIEAKQWTDLPETASLTLNLSSSGGSGKKTTESVKLSNHIGPELLDGKWHALSVPLAAFYVGENNASFDRKTAWELRLSHWSTQRRDFTVYIDDIGFEVGPPAANTAPQ
jgi:hypothetical protein